MSDRRRYKVSGPNWTAVWPLADDEAARYRAEGLVVVEEAQPERADEPDARPDPWMLIVAFSDEIGEFEDRVAGDTY